MLNQERVKIMIRLERNNTRINTKSRKISKYHKSDYIVIALIKRFFAVTIGYVFLAMIVAVFLADFLTANLNSFNYKSLIAEVVIGYIIFLAVCLGITFIIANSKYNKSRKMRREYEKDLILLQKEYEAEALRYEEDMEGEV